jgi:hypothetical protein
MKKTALQQLIEQLKAERHLYMMQEHHPLELAIIEDCFDSAIWKAKELLEKEREIAQEYAKQSKQDEVNDNPHLGYKTALVPDELLKPQPQEKQEKVKCDQDNGLREALIDIQSLILDQGNYTYGAFNEMDHVKWILEKALNQNK